MDYTTRSSTAATGLARSGQCTLLVWLRAARKMLRNRVLSPSHLLPKFTKCSSPQILSNGFCPFPLRFLKTQQALTTKVSSSVQPRALFPLSNFAIDGSTSAGAKVAVLSLVNSTASTKHINTEFIRKKIDKLTGTGRTFHLLRICMCSA